MGVFFVTTETGKEVFLITAEMGKGVFLVTTETGEHQNRCILLAYYYNYIRKWNIHIFQAKRVWSFIFNLPYTTHTRFLPHILEISTVTDQTYGCFLKMGKTMEQSNNMIVQCISKFSKISAKSIIVSNIRIICRRLKPDNISQLMNMGSCMLKKTYIQECTIEDHSEIDATLEYICTM